MFEILRSLTKAAVGVVLTPVALVADVVTLGGFLTNQDVPYTVDAIAGIMGNIEDALMGGG